MIYLGENEIAGIYLGDTEIQGIYCGDDLIYPMTISGFTVRPLVLSFVQSGEGKKLRIVSEYPWVASTTDSWLSLSAESGASGRTSITVTASENDTEAERTGTITVATTDQAYSASISVTQGITFEPTGYLFVSGTSSAHNIETNFYPGAVYADSGNYLRFEFQNDFPGTGYLWRATPNWFSFERNSSTSYQNIGESILQGRYANELWDTCGTTNTNVFTYDNGTWTMVGRNRTDSGSWTGTITTTGNLRLFPSNISGFNFYRLKVFNSPSATGPIYDFCPYLDGDDKPCIYESINETYHYSNATVATSEINFIPF